jgi:hypothetical protein
LVFDDVAWHFVFLQAPEGSAYHQSALGFLELHNPQEYGAIHGYVAGLAAVRPVPAELDRSLLTAAPAPL